ncbi:aspartate/glutamate racemase family protein [Parasphingorhabdus halotolerans]|nr:amino acid racemase [Parasphingorhabdus halotolerans]
MKHIGLVGCSAEGAALCYRTIVEEGRIRLGGFVHPEVTLHTFNLQDYMQYLAGGRVDWEEGGKKLIESVEKLKSIGADFALCPDNTIHHGVDLVRDRIPLPYLHICDVVADVAKQHNYAKVLVLGTRFTMRGTIYQRAMSAVGIECVTPTDEEVAELDRIVWEELLSGKFVPQSIAYYQQVIDRYKHEGCQAAVLGCTEIPLIINDDNSSLPTLDSTRLLALAALDMALSD